ncbi:MaoC family dehydratase [Armatimonas sp.]|uniref:MaoC family dehydratase n=1 Tax=Armatimonas sp. TaxID=1872638 RepID=UPI00375104AD
MTIVPDLTALAERVGDEVAVSEWLCVDQERIQRFADATDDHQWIHVDPERAKQESLYGTTLVHGFLLLSLLPAFSAKAFSIQSGYRMILNCGVRAARFLRPVPSGANLRARFTLQSLEPVLMGKEAVWELVLEREGEPKPVAQVEWILRYLR